MVTGDHGGFVKYWQSNMNNVKMFQAHKEPIRGIRYFLTFYLLHISGGTSASQYYCCLIAINWAVNKNASERYKNKEHSPTGSLRDDATIKILSLSFNYTLRDHIESANCS